MREKAGRGREPPKNEAEGKNETKTLSLFLPILFSLSTLIKINFSVRVLPVEELLDVSVTHAVLAKDRLFSVF